MHFHPDDWSDTTKAICAGLPFISGLVSTAEPTFITKAIEGLVVTVVGAFIIATAAVLWTLFTVTLPEVTSSNQLILHQVTENTRQIKDMTLDVEKGIAREVARLDFKIEMKAADRFTKAEYYEREALLKEDLQKIQRQIGQINSKLNR